MPATPKVFFLITDAGGGHRASANSLKAACESLGALLDVRVINMYREVWQKAEPLGRFTGVYGEDIYNFTLRHSLLGVATHLRTIARLAANAPNGRAVKDALAFLKAERPALCVSLMPFVNDTLARVCAEAGIPYALVMTDLVDIKPYMWYTPRACRDAVFVAAPCAEAAAQAREAGSERVVESGLILHPKYYDPSLRALSRGEARERLGLDPKPTTLLLSMGGFGGSAIEGLINGLDSTAQGLQIVAICGKNEVLRRRLAARGPGANKVVAVGFTQDLHLYLRAADLMAGKPGPASLFEAVAAGTPLVLDAAAAMPQEAPNAALAAGLGLAVSVEHRRDLAQTVARLASDPAARARIEAAQTAYALPDASKILVRAVTEAAGAAKG